MIVYITCNPLNFLWATFSLMESHNLLDYYKLTGGNQKVWKSKSGSGLIGQVAAWSKSGSCLIIQAAAWSKSGSFLINQAATMVISGSSLIDQAAARLKSGSCLINQDPGLWEVHGCHRSYADLIPWIGPLWVPPPLDYVQCFHKSGEGGGWVGGGRGASLCFARVC